MWIGLAFLILLGLGQAYWLVPLRDLISFAIFVWSLFGTSISWNGETYQLTSHGTLVRRTVL